MADTPVTVAVVNDSGSGYMIVRTADLRPEHELFGPEGRGYPTTTHSDTGPHRELHRGDPGHPDNDMGM